METATHEIQKARCTSEFNFVLHQQSTHAFAIQAWYFRLQPRSISCLLIWGRHGWIATDNYCHLILRACFLFDSVLAHSWAKAEQTSNINCCQAASKVCPIHWNRKQEVHRFGSLWDGNTKPSVLPCQRSQASLWPYIITDVLLYWNKCNSDRETSPWVCMLPDAAKQDSRQISHKQCS